MNNNKDINLIIEEFKQGLVNSVNQSNLPLAVCYYVMKDVFNELVSTPGTAIAVPNLKMNKAPNVNKIRFCKSLFLRLNSCFIVANILNHLCFST